MNPLRVLLWLAIASPLLAFCIPTGEQDETPDWPKEVERACTSPRYGIRLAAAKKVAQGGAAAVPAVRAFAGKRGANEIATSLVDAIAEHGGDEPAVVDLLRDWSLDRDFYWRAQAMRGLARRAGRVAERRDELQSLFTTHADDPAWLMRTHARLGLVLLGDERAAALPEPDPRARVRFAALLLQHGRTPPLQPLFDALLDERTFLGVPWGQHLAREAHQALKSWLGDEHPLAQGGSFDDEAAGVAALLPLARAKSGQAIEAPARATDDAFATAAGLEVLSCKYGDLFLQWNAAGELRAGIDGAVRATLPATAWQQLTADRAALELPSNLGVVVCDSMRVRIEEPAVHVKIAPASLPAPTADWLQRLAAAIEEADRPAVAAALRRTLQQFAAP